jgi:hypothetical protein
VENNHPTPWIHWLWAWKNPRPGKALSSLRLEPHPGCALVLSGLSAVQTRQPPLRWEARRKLLLDLPAGVKPALDLGQVASLEPHPSGDGRQFLEFSAHPEARLYLGSRSIALPALRRSGIRELPPARLNVELLVTEKGSTQPVPVRLRVTGAAGEYLAPYNRTRLVNDRWFEDYGPDYQPRPGEAHTYIDGRTQLKLPLGTVQVEISKGFEIRPVRRSFKVTAKTRQLHIELERVLPWRRRGWVSADTHFN